MGFGVFIHRSDSIYDDSPAEQYQFPSQYLGRVQKCVGDWIIYYEPRKVAATRGYFAVAKVAQVIPDPKMAGVYLALIEPGSYLDFINPVPFNGPDGVIERGVLNHDGRISGRAQSACGLFPLRISIASYPPALTSLNPNCRGWVERKRLILQTDLQTQLKHRSSLNKNATA